MTSKEKEATFKAFMVGLALCLLGGAFSEPLTGIKISIGACLGCAAGESLRRQQVKFARVVGWLAGAVLGTLILSTTL